MSAIHLQIGKERIESGSIRSALEVVERVLQLRMVDKFIMAFWDEGTPKPRRRLKSKQRG